MKNNYRELVIKYAKTDKISLNSIENKDKIAFADLRDIGEGGTIYLLNKKNNEIKTTTSSSKDYIDLLNEIL